MFKWEPKDNPLKDHAKSSPHCTVVRALCFQPQMEGPPSSQLLDRVSGEALVEEEKAKLVAKCRKQKDYALSLLVSSLKDN